MTCETKREKIHSNLDDLGTFTVALDRDARNVRIFIYFVMLWFSYTLVRDARNVVRDAVVFIYFGS